VQALTVALGVTLLATGAEFAVGWWSGSLALVADAWHMVSDAGSLGLALAATRLAARPRNVAKTFGYKRLEVLAALANGVLLGVVAVLVVVEAAGRLRAPSEVEGASVVAMGLATLVLNAGVAVYLSRRSGGNVNVKAALAHVIGDALGSAAAVVAGLVVVLTGETRADPLLSMGVSALLLWSAWRLVGETTHILMEGTPTGFDPRAIEQAIAEVPGVASVHDLHVWSIAAGEPAVMAHVVLRDGGYHGDQVARAVCETLRRRFSITHATVQPEPAPPRVVQLGTPSKIGPPAN
jgi:cobalt-zinc-cadmium efflux system protein